MGNLKYLLREVLLIQNGFTTNFAKTSKNIFSKCWRGINNCSVNLTSLYKFTGRYNNVYLNPFQSKNIFGQATFLAWSWFSDGELKPETLKGEFLPLFNMRLLRKDLPTFKKHLLKHGKVKKCEDLFHNVHLMILYHSRRTKFQKVHFWYLGGHIFPQPFLWKSV